MTSVDYVASSIDGFIFLCGFWTFKPVPDFGKGRIRGNLFRSTMTSAITTPVV